MQIASSNLHLPQPPVRYRQLEAIILIFRVRRHQRFSHRNHFLVIRDLAGGVSQIRVQRVALHIGELEVSVGQLPLQ